MRPREHGGKVSESRTGSRVKEIEFDTGFPKPRAPALRFGSINSIALVAGTVVRAATAPALRFGSPHEHEAGSRGGEVAFGAKHDLAVGQKL